MPLQSGKVRFRLLKLPAQHGDYKRQLLLQDVRCAADTSRDLWVNCIHGQPIGGGRSSLQAVVAT